MLDIQCSSTEKTTDSYMLNHWLACQRILCEVVFPQQKHATVLLENIVIRNQNMHWGFPYQITSLPGCYNIFKTKVCGPSKNEIKATPFGTKHFQFTQKDCSKSRSVYTITNLVTKKLTACPPENWNSVCKHSLVSVDIFSVSVILESLCDNI